MSRDVAVSVQNLTVRFGNFTAVDCISFEVSRGEIFGFLGANGAGKTTTIRVLCGLLHPTEGKVFVGGSSFEEGERAIKENVGYMSQKFTLYGDLSVEENLAFIASLRKLPKDKYLRQQKELFEFISFDRSLKTLVDDLPGGIKQQVSLAASLLHDPEIVFLDEPTAGVSPASRALFWSLIRKLAERGKTVFVTTHYLDEAEECERIALMREGKIIGLDSPEGLKSSTFPGPMYEFNPKVPLSFSEILELEESRLFSFFEPYGLRFHAAISDNTLWENERKILEQRFSIHTVRPSLEDVFIKRVEGRQL